MSGPLDTALLRRCADVLMEGNPLHVRPVEIVAMFELDRTDAANRLRQAADEIDRLRAAAVQRQPLTDKQISNRLWEAGVDMPLIYSHEKPTYRVLNFAAGRRAEIAKEIQQLKLEDELMAQIIERFRPLVCSRCGGAGNYMAYIEGCECDGPRQHRCDVCGGTGAAASTALEDVA